MNSAGFIYALAAAVTWGLVYAINQRVLASLTPLTLLFIGSIVTFIITLPILIFQWDSVKQVMLGSKSIWQLIVLGEVLVVAANFFIFSSIKYLGAPVAAALEISYPFFVAWFTVWLFGGSLNLYFWLGAILVFAGSAIIMKFT